MGKIMKPNKIVLILYGRYAGKKGIVVKAIDEGTVEKPFPHALVVGIQKFPRIVKRKMGKVKMHERSKIKPFIKLINYNHLMPTRYTVDFTEDKIKVTSKDIKDPAIKKKLKYQVRMKFQERYKLGKNKWFFQRLRF